MIWRFRSTTSRVSRSYETITVIRNRRAALSKNLHAGQLLSARLFINCGLRDHLACQLVEANGGTVTKQTMFPILDSSKDYEAGIEGMLDGASVKAIRFVKALKPYNGGNQSLFALHRLNIADKHRLLITVGAVRESVSAPTSAQASRYKDKGIRVVPKRADGTFEFAPYIDTFPLEDSAEIFSTISKAKLYPNANLTFEIVFGEKGVFDREPLVPSLLNLTNIIEGIIETAFNALPELNA